MTDPSSRLALVVPCYNEADRIPLDRFTGFSGPAHFLFVDDGSTDGTRDLLQSAAGESISVIGLSRNRGKGEAVRQGVLHLKTLPLFSNLDWVGFWDADLATPLEEIPGFFDYAGTYPDAADAIFGSRVACLGSRIERSAFRHGTGRLLATVASRFLRIKAYDSQCGAKIFHRKTLDAAFSEPFLSRWLFDMEIILRLGGYRIIEYPLKTWCDISGGKLNRFKVIFPTLRDLFRIRRKYL